MGDYCSYTPHRGSGGIVVVVVVTDPESHPRITMRGGRAHIHDLPVVDVITWLADGRSREEILMAHPGLEPEDITAALRYIAATVRAR